MIEPVTTSIPAFNYLCVYVYLSVYRVAIHAF